jgi:hypothetical protein
MKTFKITRYEKIKEIQIVKAKNEDEALEKNKFDNEQNKNVIEWDDYEVLSSEVEIEEVKK